MLEVSDLIRLLAEMDTQKPVVVSCEGGCVVDMNLNIYEKEEKVVIEI